MRPGASWEWGEQAPGCPGFRPSKDKCILFIAATAWPLALHGSLLLEAAPSPGADPERPHLVCPPSPRKDTWVAGPKPLPPRMWKLRLRLIIVMPRLGVGKPPLPPPPGSPLLPWFSVFLGQGSLPSHKTPPSCRTSPFVGYDRQSQHLLPQESA